MLESLFNPKSILVVGSSKIKVNVSVVSPIVFENMTKNLMGFQGHVFVKDTENPEQKYETTDLCIIVLPPRETLECLKKIHSKACIIIPGGFSEKDRKSILEIAKKKRIRILGPNSIGGVINTRNNLNTTFEKNLELKEGGISFLSQSGGIGAAVLDFLAGQKIGFSKFCWVGDMADVTDIELVDYLSKDKDTKVIAIYLEGLKEPKKFMSVLEKTKKPVIILKGGLSEESQERILSHTAAIASSSYIYSGMFKQAGIIEVDSLIELIDISMLLEHTKLSGSKTAIVSNTGGSAVLTADHCARCGLELAEFSSETRKLIKKSYPHLDPINPLDIIADADGERYRNILSVLMKDRNTDCIIAIAQLKTCLLKHQELNILNDADFKITKPVIFCAPGKEDFDKVSSILRPRFPVYDSPERIARVLKHSLNISGDS